jgi:xylulokinase
MHYFLGIDTSTTATKALLVDGTGEVVGVASTEYPFSTPRPLWSEQDPEFWWDGTVKSIRQVLAESNIQQKDIHGIGLTGQMHGLVLLDEVGQVLRPAILWNDQRTGRQCEEILQRLGKQRLIHITGNDALTGFTAPKILWVQQHEPDIWSKTRHILLPKDYVRYKLTGEYALDRAGGAGTLLFDVRRRDWSAEVLTVLDIPAGYLPPTFEGPQVTGRLTKQAATATGLEAGIPIVAGGGDQSAQAVGVGAVEPGIVALTLGTSGVVFATTAKPFIEEEGRLHAFPHAVPGRWHLMGVMLSAGGSLRWFRDTIAPEMDYEKLLAPIESISPGSEGLLFLPYLTGERTPHPDPLARGAFVGLTIRHTREHMTRSVLEGVAYGLRDSFELIKNAGLVNISQVRVSGGGAKSALWLQILADVLEVELVTVNSTEGAAYGAALLAATGAGVFSDINSACASAIKVTGSNKPSPTNEIYHKMYASYQKLYPALRTTFTNIAQIDIRPN